MGQGYPSTRVKTMSNLSTCTCGAFYGMSFNEWANISGGTEKRKGARLETPCLNYPNGYVKKNWRRRADSDRRIGVLQSLAGGPVQCFQVSFSAVL